MNHITKEHKIRVVSLKFASNTSNIHMDKSAIKEKIISPFSNTFLTPKDVEFKMIGT